MKALFTLLAVASLFSSASPASAARRSLQCESGETYRQMQVEVRDELITLIWKGESYPATEASGVEIRSGRYELCLKELIDGLLITEAKRIR